ncbi:MAG: glmS2, partial [Deltaproteobacteria bacterium]|nr:glmS2 [Deltaproteobacteria bacterium]
MCGIVGYMGPDEASGILIDALKKLEYRGYDSAGIAIWNNGKIEVSRKKGKVEELRKEIADNAKFQGSLGLAHTRWATHGVPSERNAHPHRADEIVVVHNGIIENYIELKDKLRKEGQVFLSDTDTEVIPHLIVSCMQKGMPFIDAIRQALSELQGSFAVGIINEKERVLVAAKKESPLIVGIGDGEYYLASDAPAVLDRTNRFIFLEDGDMAVFKDKELSLMGLDGKEIVRPVLTVNWTGAMAEKGGYKHFMLKEIFEQPRAV